MKRCWSDKPESVSVNGTNETPKGLEEWSNCILGVLIDIQDNQLTVNKGLEFIKKYTNSLLALQKKESAKVAEKRKGNSSRHDAYPEEKYDGIEDFCDGYDTACEDIAKEIEK